MTIKSQNRWRDESQKTSQLSDQIKTADQQGISQFTSIVDGHSPNRSTVGDKMKKRCSEMIVWHCILKGTLILVIDNQALRSTIDRAYRTPRTFYL